MSQSQDWECAEALSHTSLTRRQSSSRTWAWNPQGLHHLARSWVPKVQESSRSLGTTMFKSSSQIERKIQVGLLKLGSVLITISGDCHCPWGCEMSQSFWFFLTSCLALACCLDASHGFCPSSWSLKDKTRPCKRSQQLPVSCVGNC